jgi:hypothetical protein
MPGPQLPPNSPGCLEDEALVQVRPDGNITDLSGEREHGGRRGDHKRI